MSQTMQMYQQVGPAQFSAMIGQFAPYFASIAPQFVELRPGYAEVTFPKRREVLNHIGTVHAIALCNAAELAAGTMTDASIPAGHRWIPRGMTVEYLAKATGDVRAVADGSQIDWQATGNFGGAGGRLCRRQAGIPRRDHHVRQPGLTAKASRPCFRPAGGALAASSILEAMSRPRRPA